MKIFGICLLFVAAANADMYLSAHQVFCNCGDAEHEFVESYMAAETACAGMPVGAGYGSCVAIELGFMSEDCRSQNPDAVVAALAGHEEFYEGCIVEPFPAALNASAGWQWPGAYPYAAADSAFTSFLGCLKTLYIGTCQQKALDTFQCNA